MAGALYYKKHSVVFVIDIYVVIMRFITVKKVRLLDSGLLLIKMVKLFIIEFVQIHVYDA